MKKTPTDRQMLILAKIVDAHDRAKNLVALGNVKAEKCVYLVEVHAGIDLERLVLRETAGPADFPRLKKAVHRGEKLYAFSVQGGSGGMGGVWTPGGEIQKRLREYSETFAARRQEMDRIIELLAPMTSERAEIVATLYACWNDLLARGANAEEPVIIDEFYGWAPEKQRFDAERLQKALSWMREHDLVPTGQARTTAARTASTSRSARRSKAAVTDADTYQAVRQLLDDQASITSAEAQKAAGLDAAGIRPYLKRLVDEGRAKPEGAGRGKKYVRMSDA
jgi:hypothetical protein